MAKSYKLIVWHLLVAVLVWWMWKAGKSVGFNTVTGVDIQLPSFVAFLLLIAVIVLGYILFRQRRWSASIAGILGISFLMAFGWNWLNLLSVGVVLGFNFWSATRVRREINERRVLNIKDAFYHGLMPVVLGLFVMISFAAYQSPLAKDIERSQKLPSGIEIFIYDIVENTIGPRVEGGEIEKQNIISEAFSKL